MKCFRQKQLQGPEKGKSLKAIYESRTGYNQLLEIFGGRENVPSSVMRAKRPTKISGEVDGPTSERSYEKTCKLTKLGKKADELPESLQDAFYISGRGCGAGALSTFPQNIGRSIVLFYSNPGDTVFDPFAGHNSRMDLCVKAGRHYIGCDLSTEFMKFNFKRAKVLRKEHRSTNIELHHCDSRKVPVDNEIGDFTITSPPYYDIEYYGDEPEQLGKCKTYQGFLKGIKKVVRENLRVLKSGAYATWFVNDFRRKGKMHFYHMDLIRVAEEVGFEAVDIMVVDLGRSIRDCFPNQMFESKIIPKRHEYCLVFRKP